MKVASRDCASSTPALTAGSAARFTVQTTWPSTPADAAYEGAGMGFTVVASPFAG